MDSKQYDQFAKAVAQFLKVNRVKLGCHGPAQSNAEPFFSWRQCECCGSTLGGDRETYSFATEQGETFEADICVDCVYYLAYGQLDDTTMMEIEASRQA